MSGDQQKLECPVCMEELGDAKVTLPCGHHSCIPCFTEWARRSNTCSLCRAEFHAIKPGSTYDEPSTINHYETEVPTPPQEVIMITPLQSQEIVEEHIREMGETYIQSEVTKIRHLIQRNMTARQTLQLTFQIELQNQLKQMVEWNSQMMAGRMSNFYESN